MKKDQVQELVKNGINQLSQALQAGKSETMVNYLNVLSRFHRYSFKNILLIAIQNPNATRVAGFNAWKKLGRSVMKGEKGIAIIAPLVEKKKDEESNDQNDKVVFGFKVVHVFDISQTEGEDLPEFAGSHGEPGEYQLRLEALVRSKGIDLIYEAPGGGAEGISRNGEILVDPSLSAAEKFSVLVHELAHEILHHGDRRNETTKTIRETEAEAVAYVVCRGVGIETTTRSSDYIQLYCGNEETLSESLSHIRKTATAILDGINENAVHRSSSIESSASVNEVHETGVRYEVAC